MRKTGKTTWDISHKLSTQTKLVLLRKIFQMWLTIWNGQKWIGPQLYIIDLFAGKGTYTYNKKTVYGSPLIFLDIITRKMSSLRENLTFKLFCVEKNVGYFHELDANIQSFVKSYPQIQDKVEPILINRDCNLAIGDIIPQIKNSAKHPLFVLVDPWGIKIEKSTISKIVELRNRKDIMFNFILEGATRVGGVARKEERGEMLNQREIGSLKTLRKFIGEDEEIISGNRLEMLENYVYSVFTSKDLKVVGYDMKYPNREDIVYYLLFASKQPAITNIVRGIYAKTKEQKLGPSLFGVDLYKSNIYSVSSRLRKIERKTLLYRTGVEYADWTINHVEGCMHGCRFPCYAFMMSRKFGRFSTPSDWRKPKVVTNALELLETELSKYRGRIDSVHLSFMTDPFMYDRNRNALVEEVKGLSLGIIERLNKENIKVTTLTKGFYPDEILCDNFLKNNEYGITLVSLNEGFKRNFEPFSAPYLTRIESLRKLHYAGLRTWVSIEPYPTPNLDNTSLNIEGLLQHINFVDKIVFGKLNYNVQSTRFKDNQSFYEDIVRRLVGYCSTHKIKYHIKSGTPYSRLDTQNIFEY